MNYYTKFLLAFFISFFSLILFIIFFNFLVDPFGLYNLFSIENFNKNKTEVLDHARLVKAKGIKEIKPKSIILGSSRTLMGINPEDFKEYVEAPCYNSSFQSASFDEIYEYFFHALYHQPNLKHVLIGIDLFAFNQNVNYRDNFSFSFLNDNQLTIKEFINFFVSYKALLYSFKTIKNNKSQLISPFLPNGFMDIILLREHKIAVPLTNDDHSFIESQCGNESIYKGFILCKKKIEKYKKLVTICKEKNIKLKTFVCPIKNIYYFYYEKYNLLLFFKNLKKILNDIHPLIDFSDKNPITTEEIDLNGNLIFYDCSHFTPFTGKFILKEIYNED